MSDEEVAHQTAGKILCDGEATVTKESAEGQDNGGGYDLARHENERQSSGVTCVCKSHRKIDGNTSEKYNRHIEAPIILRKFFPALIILTFVTPVEEEGGLENEERGHAGNDTDCLTKSRGISPSVEGWNDLMEGYCAEADDQG